jgi:bifunctional non-homologous end joining protein LigD
MASKDVLVNIENQVLKLSNLDKILFPYSGIIKAELIQYYQKIAPYMLPHIKHRPLTLIRFPDGIDKIKFYSKKKADWTPDWIDSIALPSSTAGDETSSTLPEEISYVMANNIPSLIWIANLAAIEIHSMTIQSSKIGFPDMLIFDLDPPEGIAFAEIKIIAQELKTHLESYGYIPFLKTSGSKGLHIYVPIINNYSQEEVVTTAKEIAKDFIAAHPNTTLAISKEKRTTKILIDIYRNHRSQTCASPYSVRGKEGAPISMPLFWDDLDSLQNSQEYNINNVFDYLTVKGDPWANIYVSHKPLYQKLTILGNNFPIKKFDETTQIETLEKESSEETQIEKNLNEVLNSASNSIKTRLETYSQKRNLDISPEPAATIIPNTSGELRYVIQKHDASNLHYDLRLESDGVLLSWAIPKAMPDKPGVKRMAIQTEAHPMKYLDFEGQIPAEEYGGGAMWIFDTGILNYIKKEERKIRFRLSKGKITGEFYIYNTDGNKWLLECVEQNTVLETVSIQPMLAEQVAKIPTQNYHFEIKWDGIRVIIKKNGNDITILSKNGNDLTEKFPKIVQTMLEFDANSVLLDGEIVCLNDVGIPVFSKVISRMHLTGTAAIQHASIHNKATVYLFDLLFMDGLDTRNLPIEKRRRWIEASMKDTEYVRFSKSFDDGEALFAAIKAQKMEGIICKKLGSSYLSNTRSNNWQKVKVKNIEDAIIIGYTKGSGDRSHTFGSFILAQYENDKLVYKGKVGSGFNSQQLKEFTEQLKSIPEVKKIISETIDEESQAVWIEPKLWCEIQIASLTNNKTFREPVFVRLREDLE